MDPSRDVVVATRAWTVDSTRAHLATGAGPVLAFAAVVERGVPGRRAGGPAGGRAGGRAK